MGPVATLVAAALCLQFPAVGSGAHGSYPDATTSRSSPTTRTPGAIGEGGTSPSSDGTESASRSCIFVSANSGSLDDSPRRRSSQAQGMCERSWEVSDSVPGEEHPLQPFGNNSRSKQVWRVSEVQQLPAAPEDALDAFDRASCLEPDFGLHPGPLLQGPGQEEGDKEQGDQEPGLRGGQSTISEEDNGLQVSGQAEASNIFPEFNGQRRDAGRSSGEFMVRRGGQRPPGNGSTSPDLQHRRGREHAGSADPTTSAQIQKLPPRYFDLEPPWTNGQVGVEVRQPGLQESLEDSGGSAATGTWSTSLLQVQHPGDAHDQRQPGPGGDGASVHLGRLRTTGLHVRDGGGISEDGDLQHRSSPRLSGWLERQLPVQEQLDESFEDLLETLQVDVASTYITTGCGESVRGVAPISTRPIISRRVICTHNGEAWSAVSVSSVPGDNYSLGGNVHYLVLYEFMPDFLDYMITAECSTEVTLTKPMKAELNEALDSMLGDQSIYWNLWTDHEAEDDVAEIYGSLTNSDDTIVELYSPPRVVEEARKRGLRAELSIDLTTGYDLSMPEQKEHVKRELAKRKPKLLVTSPPCTKFSPLQNLRKDWETFEEEWHGAVNHVDFSMECLEEQLHRGGHGLHEHPDTATSWTLPSVQNYLNHDEIILVKSHQCRFGLRVHQGLNRKSTLFATSCDAIAVNLQRLCECELPHEPLVGGLPKAAETYPPKLVQAMIDGLIQEWVDEQRGCPPHLPDRGDLEQWMEELGRQDFQWRQFHDCAVWVSNNKTHMPRQGPGHRTLRWTWVRNLWDNKWMQLERARTGKPPKLEVAYKAIIVLYYHPDLQFTYAEISTVTAAEKTMVLRAHINLGHPSVKEFARLLKSAGTRPDIVQYVLQEFSCEGCAKEKRQPTRLPAATPRTYDFNVVIGIDLLFVFGADDKNELPVLNVTCQGTLYSTFVLVHPTRRSSALVWQAFTMAWLRTFGAPSFIILDQGLEFMGAFVEGMENHGVVPLWIDRDAPYQNGITERRGGLFKEVY